MKNIYFENFFFIIYEVTFYLYIYKFFLIWFKFYLDKKKKLNKVKIN